MLRRIPSMLAVGALSAAALTAGPAASVHSQQGNGSCAKGAQVATPLSDPVIVDQVGNGEIHRYRLDVPAGEQGIVQVHGLNGDIDLYVCTNSGAHACTSTNMYPLPDGCHFEEISVTDPVFDIEWVAYGAVLEGGKNYRLDVQHCFSSEDTSDGGGSCDYSFPAPDGTLDPLPPIVYVLAWSLI